MRRNETPGKRGDGGGVEISESLHWESKRDGELSRRQSKGRVGGGGVEEKCNYKPATRPWYQFQDAAAEGWTGISVFHQDKEKIMK